MVTIRLVLYFILFLSTTSQGLAAEVDYERILPHFQRLIEISRADELPPISYNLAQDLLAEELPSFIHAAVLFRASVSAWQLSETAEAIFYLKQIISECQNTGWDVLAAIQLRKLTL